LVFLRDSNVTSSFVVNLTDGNRYRMTFLKISGKRNSKMSIF
jgi:hypothetical protein